MLFVPLQAIPNQSVLVQLNGQNCQINAYQKMFGLFLDLLVNNELIIGGQLCENLVLIVRSAYLGFSGDIGFFDSQGSTDPTYTGLGTRYFLTYLFPSELPPGVS